MGGLFGEADTWIPGLTTENFYVICEKALFEQGFFVIGPLYATSNQFKLPGVNVDPDLCPDRPGPMHSGLFNYGPGMSCCVPGYWVVSYDPSFYYHRS